MYIVETGGSAEPISREEASPVRDKRQMTCVELRRLGMPHVVYLRCGTVEGEPAYAIHAADGTAMAVVDDLQGAVELACANDMIFVAVH